MEIIHNGKIRMTGSREMKGITPEMMVWWSTHRTKERIKMWHPDHLDFKVLYKPEKGHVGSVYKIKEKHGKYTLDMKLTVYGVTDKSFTHVQKARGYIRNTHIEFEATPDGMIMHSTSIIGSDNPVFGRLWNFITRKFLYTEKYQAASAQHSGVEEAANLQEFLPKLYAECAGKEE